MKRKRIAVLFMAFMLMTSCGSDAEGPQEFEIVTDPERIDECDMVLLCVGEKPYAEWLGDTTDLSIVGDMALAGNKKAIEEAKASVEQIGTGECWHEAGWSALRE